MKSPKTLARELGADCDSCPLKDCGRGPVLGQIHAQSKLIAIGESPGKEEVKRGHPYVGPAGQVYAAALRQAGYSRYREVSTSNVLLCQSPTNRTLAEYISDCRRAGKASPIVCCAPRLEKELRLSGADNILTMGKHAMEQIARHYGVKVYGIKKQRGHPVKLTNGYLVPTLEPAYALRRAKEYLPAIRDDIKMACSIAERGLDWQDVEWSTLDTLEKVERWVREAERINEPVMVDIETTKIKPRKIFLIGWGQWRKGKKSIVVLPIHSLDGSPCWTSKEEVKLKALCQIVHDGLEIQGQNATFDTDELLEKEFMTDRDKSWRDLRTCHVHTRESDCPHDLNHISSRFGQYPIWKVEHEHEILQGLSEKELQRENHRYRLYNARDVGAQMDSLKGVELWIKHDGTARPCAIDHQLLPRARDMGKLGLFVDVERRNSLLEKCNTVTAERLGELRELTKLEKFNPGSPMQVKKWLYTTKKCPEFRADGEEVQDGDKASSGEKALLKLFDHGVPPEVERFIDLLLEYRGYSKLASNYLTDKNTVPSEWPGIERLQYSVMVPGTSTGRFTTSPTVQTIPSRGLINIKQIFVPPPGHVIVDSDFEQVEVRIFAAVVGDELVLRAIREGKDLHALTAAELFSEIYKQDAKELYQRIIKRKEHPKDSEEFRTMETIRSAAKGIRFSTQYGAGGNTMYKNMSTARDKATNARLFPNLQREQVNLWEKLWKQKTPWTKRWNDEVLTFIAKHGYVEEPVHGRRRFFRDGLNSPNEGPNLQIQGGAAAFANKSMLRITSAVPYQSWSKYTGLAYQIHDDLGGYCPEDRVNEMVAIFEQAMHHEFRGITISGDVEVKERMG